MQEVNFGRFEAVFDTVSIKGNDNTVGAMINTAV
jgi:hypothetical protein